ncbi:MAG: hypothetical protein H6702_17795, partial [Myxococcales bacterium]|nr:hypothetical protein [Myxococcales bacterium]
PTRPGGRTWATAAAPVAVQAGDAPTWITVFRRGVVPPEAAWVGAQGLRVERAWLDADGQPVDPAAVPLGQLVFSRLTVHNPGAQAVPHVALEEPLPAGVTVEPGRLGQVATPAWAADAPVWHTSHVDARDDHFRAYGPLPPRSTVVVIHALRATAAGNFHRPGVSVEAMYDPDTRARTAADRLGVIPRFAERI